MRISKPHIAVIALIAANIIWGATPPIFKWALEDISPFTLAFLRFFIAAIIMVPFLRNQDLKIKKRDWPKLFILAFVGIFIHISFFFLGLELSSSISAPIIASAGPIFLMIAGILVLKEHPGIKKILGGAIGLIGVLIIIVLPILGQEFDGSVLGNLFFVISTIAAVVHTIILKGLSKTYHPLPLVFWSFVIASVMFLPTFANSMVNNGGMSHIGIQGWTGVIFGAIFASVIAYSLFYFAVKYVLASEVGIFTYIDPIVTIVIAIPLLGEVPTPTYIFGSLLVFLGIYIAEGRLHYHPLHLLNKKPD